MKIKNLFPTKRSKSNQKQKSLSVKKETKKEESPKKHEEKEVKVEAKLENQENERPVNKIEEAAVVSPKVKPVSLDKITKVTPVKAEPVKVEPVSPKPDVSSKSPEADEKEPETKPVAQEELPSIPEPSGDSTKKPPKPTSSKKSKTKSKKSSEDDDEDFTPTTKTSKTKSITSTKSTQKTQSTKKSKKKKEIVLSPNQKKITDFNFIRRSRRVPTTEKRKIEEQQLKFYLASDKDEKLDHIVMKMTEGKGRGIFANKDLSKGDFVVEYAGDLMSLEEGKAREDEYSEDAEIGCYIYFFSFKGKRYCIDATAESGRYGRLLNHSKQKANCKTRLVEEPEGIPRLIIEAKVDIKKDVELLYDYGDRSAKALKAHPWLKE